MRANVFTDKALGRYAGQFVWLSLDVEKAENAAYKKKYAADALPMFFVLDPKTEKAALRWVGGATVPQLQKILADGAAAVKGTRGKVETALARADRFYGEGAYDQAAAAYREAIAQAPPTSPRYGRTVESLLYSLYETKDYAACAKAPDGRAVYDSHRLGTYLDLGEPERAIPMLQASERDLPGDYNPSARLAVAYRAMKKYDDAIAASDRALAKAYGPRKLGILQTRSDIYNEMGNLPEARKAMQQAVDLAESLPEGQRSEKSIASLKKKLDTLSQ